VLADLAEAAQAEETQPIQQFLEQQTLAVEVVALEMVLSEATEDQE
jgi:hypothetical protein